MRRSLRKRRCFHVRQSGRVDQSLQPRHEGDSADTHKYNRVLMLANLFIKSFLFDRDPSTLYPEGKFPRRVARRLGPP